MIDTLDKLVNALGNLSQRIVMDKSSLSNVAAGQYVSLWRTTGQPGQGAIPTTVALCDKNLTGAFVWTDAQVGQETYIGYAYMASSLAMMSPEIHDRLAHIGGLLLNTNTLQNSVIDALSLAIPADRMGDANYSDIQWWLEVYADGGATASNATINVTYNDGTTGNLNVVAVGGTLRIGRMIPLNNLIPAAQAGKYIRGINSVQLSASTTVAGNFGFTATRPRAQTPLIVANKAEAFSWDALGFPSIPNSSCLMVIMLTSQTTTGTLRGGLKLPQG